MEYNTEFIEKYLLGQLTETEKKNFEAELERNPDLKKKVEAQKVLMEGIEQYGMQQQVNKAMKQAKLGRLIKKAVVLTLTVAVLAAGAWYVKKKMDAPKEHLQYELNEEGKKNWSDADKNLPSQFFKINPKKDTILETERGIIFQVKAGTFLNKSGEVPGGPIDFEVKEAMTPMDIIKGGLSTTSDEKLLETGGMFYVNARDGKEVLNIDKSKAINVHVPNNGEKEMNLFDGQRMENGKINWVNPQAMTKTLKTVDILSLNFYPPNFLDTLQAMGYDVKNKILTDSIYYSMNCYGYNGSAVNKYRESDSRDTLARTDSSGIPKLTGFANSCEINPSRIRTIWDRKFNNTILATREFEERLQLIFQTCNAAIFRLYSENLNKELWELDSIAADVAGGKRDRFIDFAKRRDGGVKISDTQSVRLQNYIKQKKEIYDKACRDAIQKLYNGELKKAEEAMSKRYEYENERSLKEVNNLFEEIDRNLDEAYSQLGQKRVHQVIKNVTTVPANYQSGIIVTGGWKNVDRYVIEATINRTTLDYTDPESGKKAVIEYKEASVDVTDKEKYDRVLCYLLPEQLSSFQLMKEKGNLFAENLNMTFKYSLIVVGYKGEKTFYWEEKNAAPRNYSVSLKEMEAGTLMQVINSRYNFTGTSDIIKDIDQQLFEQKETIRVEKIRKREEITWRLHRVVFPCEIISH